MQSGPFPVCVCMHTSVLCGPEQMRVRCDPETRMHACSGALPSGPQRAPSMPCAGSEMHERTRIHAFACLHVRTVCVCICVCMHAFVCAQRYGSIHAYMHGCMYGCVHVYT